MICKNCGAEFSDQLSICPYCGTENYRAALSEHREELERIHGRTEGLKYMKEQIAQKATRITGYVVLGVAIFLLLMVGASYEVAHYKAVHSLEIQKGEIEVLEECYQNGEYDKLCELIGKSEYIYRPSYTKYYRVAEAYEDYEYVVSYMDFIYDNLLEEDMLGREFWYVFQYMNTLKGYEEEGFPYGEEEGIKGVEKMYRDYLTEKFMITDAEITEALESLSEEPEDERLQLLAHKSLARILKEKAK